MFARRFKVMLDEPYGSRVQRKTPADRRRESSTVTCTLLPTIPIWRSPFTPLQVVGPTEPAIVSVSQPSTRTVMLPLSVADSAIGDAAGDAPQNPGRCVALCLANLCRFGTFSLFSVL